ncbi:MAG TPA: SRPBCC family protein [Dermatophilaceae bacterium]|nr:SRPBCC family protein [Dermatophilaceae bacterium]
MELSHTFTVASGVDATWAHFMDLEKVGGCFPGATVTDVSGDEFAGTVKVKLGPIALVYAGTGRFVDRDDAAHRAVLEAKGKDKRGNGTAGATVTITLSPEGTGTRAEVVTDLAVTGKPAQFGRGVMQDVSDKLLGVFLECLEHQLAGDFDDEPAADDAAAESAESAEAVAPATAIAEPAAPAVAAASPAPTPAPALTPSNAAATAGSSGPPQRSRPAYQPPSDDAVDLGAAVLPVLAKTYGPYLLSALAGFLIGVAIRRRG